ncbi:MAG: GNAT family N-acetyltransferase [Paracoccaceae bacterium]
MALCVRVAQSSDLAQVDALLARAYPRLLKPDYPPSVLVTALPLISRAQPGLVNSGTYYVAELGKDAPIVGAGGWSRDRSDTTIGHIRHIVSDDRHVRKGVARALLTQVFKVAAGQGVHCLHCQATRTAVPFYIAMGFETVGPIDVPLRPGISFPAVFMTRLL